MTPDERELRRALEARSGELSPEFHARLTSAFDEGRPSSILMQAVAMVAVVAITLGTVGVLLLSRNARNVSHQGPASGSRLVSPIPWISQEMPIRLPNTAQLSAPSSGVLWTLVGNTALFRSTDKGSTWEKRSLPAAIGGGLMEVSFVDDRQGWLLHPGVAATQCSRADAEIWHTTDAGATWKQVVVEKWTPSNPDSLCLEGLSFVDPLRGFMFSNTNWHATIYRTVDGGKTWSGSPLPDPPDFHTELGSTLQAGLVKQFGNALYVVARAVHPGDSPIRSWVFRSTNGGATWSSMTKVPSMYVAMVTESRWLQLIVPGQSMESINTGQQWHPYASDFNTDTPVGSPQIVFADSQVGYAEGRGALQRTVDGGLHWERIATPGTTPPIPTPSPYPTPTPVPLLPVTDPGFTCRLAVGTGSFGSDSTGGFVAVPRGAFERDPTAPAASGSGLAFDAPFSRWVLASPEVISADGSEYAWTERQAGGKLHVTRVADGTDRTFAVEKPPDAGPIPVPIAITKDGVLLTYGWEGAWGVWRLDRASGSLTKLNGLPSPSYGAGAIWVTPTRGPNHVGMYSDGDTLARFDLASGAVVDWFHRDNLAVRYAGVDGAGNPWVVVNPGSHTTEFWRVLVPGKADLILFGQNFSRVITDKHGTWFANASGVYLYSGGRLQRVSSASVGEVVGPCV